MKSKEQKEIFVLMIGVFANIHVCGVFHESIISVTHHACLVFVYLRTKTYIYSSTVRTIACCTWAAPCIRGPGKYEAPFPP
jgi:hypothetical protein